MKATALYVSAALMAAAASLQAPGAAAQTPPAAPAASQVPLDPWPRKVDLSNATVLVYQPQINKWDGNQLDFRAAVAIQPVGAKSETFGTFFATARTQVDRVARTVVLENVAIYRSDFPLLPDRGAQYATELARRVASDIRTISLDRMEAALAAAGVKAPPVQVNNAPPQIYVANQPALLIPIDGAPVLKPVAQTRRFERVINTRALLLKGGAGANYYLHVYDGWMMAESLAGPWLVASPGPFERSDFDAIAADLSKKALKVIRGDRRKLPFSTAKGAACFILDDDGQGMGGAFRDAMIARFGDVRTESLTPDTADAASPHFDAGTANPVVIAIFSKISASKGRSGISPKLRDAAFAILKQAKAARRPSAVISFDSPYILDQFKDADVLIAGYDRMDAIQTAAAELLTGTRDKGRGTR